jgi:hypothetical protein
MNKRKEQDLPKPDKESRAAKFMAARILEADRRAREYQDQLDPRQK